MFYSGISGLQLPTPRYLMAPEYQGMSRLEIYATLFNSIEINSSFYNVPVAKTIRKWSTQVGPDFKFTFKFFKEISHGKRLHFEPSMVGKFLQAIEIPSEQKGSLLIQFPPSLKSDNLNQLGDLLHTIRTHHCSNNWDIAVEFRSKDWYDDDTFELIKTNKAIVVIHDKSASATPISVADIFDVVYLRFHGPAGNYRGSYSQDFLLEYSSYIRTWLSEGKTVYAYFNNTMGDAVANLMALNKPVE